MIRKYSFLTICLLTFLMSEKIVFSQCPAPDKIVKSSGKDKFFINKQSKSGALKAGESYELTFNAQEGYDYKITSAIDARGKNPVPFEIYEMATEKENEGGFKKVKKVIKTSSGEEPVDFQIDKPTVLIVKVTLPPSDSKNPECVAILIEDRKTTKTGF